MWDALWRNGKVATMTAGATRPFGLIEDGAVAAEDGRIAWIGAESALPGAPATCARTVHDLGGRLLTPGWSTPTTTPCTTAMRSATSSCSPRAARAPT